MRGCRERSRFHIVQCYRYVEQAAEKEMALVKEAS